MKFVDFNAFFCLFPFLGMEYSKHRVNEIFASIKSKKTRAISDAD